MVLSPNGEEALIDLDLDFGVALQTQPPKSLDLEPPLPDIPDDDRDEGGVRVDHQGDLLMMDFQDPQDVENGNQENEGSYEGSSDPDPEEQECFGISERPAPLAEDEMFSSSTFSTTPQDEFPPTCETPEEECIPFDGTCEPHEEGHTPDTPKAVSQFTEYSASESTNDWEEVSKGTNIIYFPNSLSTAFSFILSFIAHMRHFSCKARKESFYKFLTVLERFRWNLVGSYCHLSTTEI